MKRVALLTALTLAGCTSGGSLAAHPAASQGRGMAEIRAAAGQACRADLAPRPLPSWAHAGFDPPTQPMPYVLGDSGDIIAVLWADHDPLKVPAAADRNNKILWVCRASSKAGGLLRIQATLPDTGQTQTRIVDGGPGPSTIDLPAPGCWSFDLTWGEHHDHLQLEYVSG